MPLQYYYYYYFSIHYMEDCIYGAKCFFNNGRLFISTIEIMQVANQIINWLYQEAVMVGIKANRDFLCLCFELEQGETLGLVANVDPEDSEGCISWWLVMEDSFAEEQKLHMNITDGASEYRKFLGHLSLELLYATLMDLVGLCSGGGRQ